MIAVSVLFKKADDLRRTSPCEMPSYFTDLNLDQVVDAIAQARPSYALAHYYYRALQDADEVVYRQEVFRDLEEPGLLKALTVFSDRMRSMRRSLESLEKIYSTWHHRGWFLEAARDYRDALDVLARYLEGADLGSRALRAFKVHLLRYLATEAFAAFSREIDDLGRDFAQVRYCVTIRNLTVKVRRYDEEVDYGADIEETFSRFSQGSVKSYLAKYPESAGIDHVQAQILECVAKLYPELFGRLDSFCSSHATFIDETIDSFEKEMQFYLSWLDCIGPLRSAGLQFCLPTVSPADKAVAAREVFDVALAKKVVLSSHPVVKNDFSLSGAERILIVTGPNQGGKTTFARIFGQLHHLASIGCPVPAAEARLFLFDHMFSHFEREESLKSHRGKLHEELLSIHASLEAATPDSILILNEVFTSTTLKDSVFLSRRIMERIARLDALCVCVTFLDELASLGEKFVSLVCAVDPHDPAIRTFKIERRPADGLAYARALAEKRGLTYEQLKGRIAS
jgi:tetratricopeptide (TPR) repeat protein